jgi:hypothetical protein
MAIKTFTTGEVLTAADTNTYLANSGLVFVKQQTVGSGVSSVAVTDAFSTTYDNYRITYAAGVGSNAVSIGMVLGASTASYYIGLQYVTYSTGVVSAAATNNGASWPYVGEASPGKTSINIDLLSPFLAKATVISGSYAGSVAGQIAGYHDVATSYTGFTISTAGNTMTGGTITIYGYRKS